MEPGVVTPASNPCSFAGEAASILAMIDPAPHSPAAAPETGFAPIRRNARVLLAALVGTSVEFYDFYIFGTAAALVFGWLYPGQRR